MKSIIKISVIVSFIALCGFLAGPDDDEKSAINAIKSGNVELLKLYLDKHPDKNCLFSNGNTGLYYAIIYDKDNICEFLLSGGADPDFMVDERSTMYWAIKNGRARIVRFLIEYGASVNKPDEKLKTPLIYAAEFDNPEICKILVDRGAALIPKNLKEKPAIDYVLYKESPSFLYLHSMEKPYLGQDTVPSMHDGPYIYWENDNRIVLTYYEHNQDKSLTRIIEKTIEIGKDDTIVGGIGWDRNSYRIRRSFTPDPFKTDSAGNIFVIGDIHGKYRALLNLLVNNKIIDSSLVWIFGGGHLVLLGDIFDRGDMVTETLWFLYQLEIQARAAGGDVHLLLGNHEVMELTGDDRYLSEKYNYFTQYTRVYYFQIFEKNTVLGRWLRSKNVISRINDDLFLHAGISPQFAAFDFPYPDINLKVQNYLNSDDYDMKKGSLEDIILGPIGPQWYRGYSTYNGIFTANENENFDANAKVQEVTQQFVNSYLSSKGLKRMILGHNEQRAITALFEGKVISADVEIDESGKTAQGLLISGDQLFRCLADGTKERIE